MGIEQFPNDSNSPRNIPTSYPEDSASEELGRKVNDHESYTENVTLEQVERTLDKMEAVPKSEKDAKFVDKLKKYVALAVVGLAPLLVSGCGERSPSESRQHENKAIQGHNVRTERKTSGRLYRDKEREVRREILKMIFANERQIMSGSFDLSTNSFLGYYKERVGQSVPEEHESVMSEGKEMRKLEIAEKYGVNIRKPKSKNIPGGIEQKRQFKDIFCPAGVPLVFEIDGKRIEASKADLIGRELDVLQGYYNLFRSDPDSSKTIEKLEQLGIGNEEINMQKSKPIKPAKTPSKGGVRRGPDFDGGADF